MNSNANGMHLRNTVDETVSKTTLSLCVALVFKGNVARTSVPRGVLSRVPRERYFLGTSTGMLFAGHIHGNVICWAQRESMRGLTFSRRFPFSYFTSSTVPPCHLFALSVVANTSNLELTCRSFKGQSTNHREQCSGGGEEEGLVKQQHRDSKTHRKRLRVEYSTNTGPTPGVICHPWVLLRHQTLTQEGRVQATAKAYLMGGANKTGTHCCRCVRAGAQQRQVQRSLR